MCEKLLYEQKVNIVKEMSSCYSSDEEIEVEICNTNKMNNIMKTKLEIEPVVIEGIFKTCLKKNIIENGNEAMGILNDFYKYHPFLVPFVGKDYPQNDHNKFLYVLESHYLPSLSRFYDKMPETEENKNKWLKEQWYKCDFSWEKLQSSTESEISLYREDIEYIWTESVVKNNIKNNKRFRALFGKILKPIFDIKNEQIEDTIQSIAFMNYFLRPSEYTGTSIKHEYIDSLFSYLNLIKVWEALDKPNIIICSSKARYSFNSYFEKHTDFLEKNDIEDKTSFTKKAEFCLCNHPSNMSWNRKRKVSEAEKEKYRLKNEYTTSDEVLGKFKESVSKKDR